MLRHLFIAAFVLHLAAPTAAAQDPLTLRAAIEQALERHPAVRAARAGADQATATVRATRATVLPRVDFVESWQRGNQPVFVFGSLLAQQRFTEANFAIDALNRPDAISNHHAAVIVEQALFDGSRSPALATSRLESRIAEQDVRRAVLDVYRQTIAAYGRVISAEAHLTAASAAIDRAREDLRRAEERAKAGVESHATVLAFRVELADADVRRLRAEAASRDARASLNVTIGATIDDHRPLTALDDLPFIRVDLAALELQALENRPEAQQARLRLQTAEQEQRRARSAFLPFVSAQAALDANGHTFVDRAATWTVGIQVRWNLFAGGGDVARVKAAAAAVSRAAADQQRIDDGVRLELREAIHAHDSARARRTASQAMVEQALESARIVRERYTAGLAPASDVMRAAELTRRAQAADVDALVDVHVTASAIDRAVGRFESRK